MTAFSEVMRPPFGCWQDQLAQLQLVHAQVLDGSVAQSTCKTAYGAPMAWLGQAAVAGLSNQYVYMYIMLYNVIICYDIYNLYTIVYIYIYTWVWLHTSKCAATFRRLFGPVWFGPVLLCRDLGVSKNNGLRQEEHCGRYTSAFAGCLKARQRFGN